MKRIINGILILGLGVAPAIIGVLTLEPVLGQSQTTQREELQQLLDQAAQQTQQGNPQQSLESLRKLLKKAQQLNHRRFEADALLGIGLNLLEVGDPEKSLEAYKQVLPILREIGSRQEEIITLNNIGAISKSLGRQKPALEAYKQALSILQRTGDRDSEAAMLTQIGGVYDQIGQSQKALEIYNQALIITRRTGNRNGEAAALNNIGRSYTYIGESQKALEILTQVLPIRRQIGDRKGEATTLNNIGVVYNRIGQTQKSLEFYKQALQIQREIGNLSEEAIALNNIADVYDYLKQPQKALEFLNEALLITKQTGNLTAEAIVLNGIGVTYQRIGQPKKALDVLQQALSIRRQVGDRTGEANTLANIGGVYSTIKQPQKALSYKNQALPITQQVGDRSGEAAILSEIGLVYRDINQFSEAISYLERSTQLTLALRQVLVKENRSFFLQANQDTATSLVKLLIDTNQSQRAYEWTNRATTADLADYTRLLGEKVRDPEAQKTLNQLTQQQQQLKGLRQRLQDKFSEDLAREIRTQEAELTQKTEAAIKRFPELAELLETTPTDIAQLRASIPVGTTVIHPVLLTNVNNVPNAIALFILTKDTLTVQKIPVDPRQLDELLTNTYKQLINRDEHQFFGNLEQLYDLLIRHIETQIQATKPKQLSIIATGKLRYIPFEALYDKETDQYLIQKYPISYLTRLSTRSLDTQNNSNSITPKRVLALGNPIPKDPLALPASETEVNTITQIFPGSESFIRNQATLDTFKIQALRFPFLHLATHGCFQKGGCPKLGLEENTILFADQRFNIADAALLGLQNVDLITLSACQTALKTESNGEEIAGLAYLFERAGAKATIASLWNAEDKTTQAIMVQFYQNLKQGMSKGEALQKAKLSQVDSHPFFWAPFVLIGDPR
jgi:CHAT domain-containing protein/Tfp pilus assembly protein PilF